MIVIKSVLSTLVCITITAMILALAHEKKGIQIIALYLCVLYAALTIALWMG